MLIRSGTILARETLSTCTITRTDKWPNAITQQSRRRANWKTRLHRSSEQGFIQDPYCEGTRPHASTATVRVAVLPCAVASILFFRGSAAPPALGGRGPRQMKAAWITKSCMIGPRIYVASSQLDVSLRPCVNGTKESSITNAQWTFPKVIFYRARSCSASALERRLSHSTAFLLRFPSQMRSRVGRAQCSKSEL